MRELIQSVRRRPSPPSAHSVFTITVNEDAPKSFTRNNNSNNNSNGRSGQLMIVTLGASVSSSSSSSSAEASQTPPFAAEADGIGGAVGDGWMADLQDTLSAMESKRPALRSRSRVATLFKETLLGQVGGSIGGWASVWVCG